MVLSDVAKRLTPVLLSAVFVVGMCGCGDDDGDDEGGDDSDSRDADAQRERDDRALKNGHDTIDNLGGQNVNHGR